MSGSAQEAAAIAAKYKGFWRYYNSETRQVPSAASISAHPS